jgi:hypothetical protein
MHVIIIYALQKKQKEKEKEDACTEVEGDHPDSSIYILLAPPFGCTETT